jgi:HK97 family phage prohead protease
MSTTVTDPATRRKPRHKVTHTRGVELRTIKNVDGGELVRMEGLAYRSGPAGRTVIYDQFGAFREEIAPGAARHLLTTTDTRFLIGHADGSVPLARTISGTLTLLEDAEGLRLVALLDPNSFQANDLVSAVRRGDLTGLSIRFSVDEAYDDWNATMDSRVIRRFKSLPEISAVWSPAYSTSKLSAPVDGDDGSRAAIKAAERRKLDLEIEIVQEQRRRRLRRTR